MDATSWDLFATILQLMQQFARFRYQPPVHPQIVNSFPDWIMDFYFTLGQIHWPGLDLQHPRLFQHQGIVYSSYVEVPSPHFFLEGSLAALHHCLLRAMLHDLISRLRAIFNRMSLRGDILIPPYPSHYDPSPVDLSGTIRLPTTDIGTALPSVTPPSPNTPEEDCSLAHLHNFAAAFNISPFF
jgi:hypothetical protein